MKYRLMFSDYDGTFGVGTEIDVESVAAVKEFEQKGGKFVICTGRMYCSIIKTCRKYGLKGLVISYQGAMINEIETGKTVLSGGVPQNLALSVFNDMKKEGMQPIAEIDDVLDFARNFHAFFQVFKLKNAFLHNRCRVVFARVAVRFLQFFDNVVERCFAELVFFAQSLACFCADFFTGFYSFVDFARNVVIFGVNPSVV